MLGEFILSQRAAAGTLSPEHYVVTTLVTTAMIGRVADRYGVRFVGDLLVGFKYIAEATDREGPDTFVYGCEESHGYVVGQYARDKDGAVACMLISELAAELKSQGRTLHAYLAELYHQHGYHHEKTVNLFMEGSEGMAAMKRLMQAFRDHPPETLAGIPVLRVRDYLNSATTNADGKTESLQGPVGDMVIMDLEEAGNYVAARPSGTEAKIKLYAFTRLPAEESVDLDAARDTLSAGWTRLRRIYERMQTQIPSGWARGQPLRTRKTPKMLHSLARLAPHEAREKEDKKCSPISACNPCRRHAQYLR